MPHDVCDSLRPILIIFLLVGIFPCRLVGGGNTGQRHRLQTTVYGTVITVAYICGFVVSYAFSVDKPQIFIGHFVPNDYFSHFIDLFMITVGLIAVIGMLCRCLRHKRQLIALIDVLVDIDAALTTELGGRLRHGQLLWEICKRSIISWIVLGTYVQSSREVLKLMRRHVSSMSAWTSYFLPTMMMNCVLFEWITIARMLRHRFAVLNGVSERFSVLGNLMGIRCCQQSIVWGPYGNHHRAIRVCVFSVESVINACVQVP